MKKYITKRNIINTLLFIQFVISSVMNIYQLTPEMIQHLSLLLLLIGYWVNTEGGSDE